MLISIIVALALRTINAVGELHFYATCLPSEVFENKTLQAAYLENILRQHNLQRDLIYTEQRRQSYNALQHVQHKKYLCFIEY